eukprot:768510-Hanusia_phi.AAC.3
MRGAGNSGIGTECAPPRRRADGPAYGHGAGRMAASLESAARRSRRSLAGQDRRRGRLSAPGPGLEDCGGPGLVLKGRVDKLDNGGGPPAGSRNNGHNGLELQVWVERSGRGTGLVQLKAGWSEKGVTGRERNAGAGEGWRGPGEGGKRIGYGGI